MRQPVTVKFDKYSDNISTPTSEQPEPEKKGFRQWCRRYPNDSPPDELLLQLKQESPSVDPLNYFYLIPDRSSDGVSHIGIMRAGVSDGVAT